MCIDTRFSSIYGMCVSRCVTWGGGGGGGVEPPVPSCNKARSS